MTRLFSSVAPIFPPNWLENSVALSGTIFRIAVIDTFSRMDGNCVASSVKVLYLGILYRFIGAEKIFVWFFPSLHRWKKFRPTKLYRFIRFFSQKLCICIALIDTFLSIAAYLWLYRLGLVRRKHHSIFSPPIMTSAVYMSYYQKKPLHYI